MSPDEAATVLAISSTLHYSMVVLGHSRQMVAILIRSAAAAAGLGSPAETLG